MIRPVTCITALLAFGSGLYLYQTKHQAQMVDRQIEHAVKAITATKMQTRELAAAWTVLGSPDRLQQLSDQYLDIKPVAPGQFVAMADLDSRLPAPRALLPPSSDAPPDSGSDTAPIAATEPPASEPSVSSGVPATAIASAPLGASAAPRASAPPGAFAPPVAPAATTRAVAALPAPAPTPSQATETAKAASRPPDHKPNDPPRPVHDVAQTHPTPPPRPANKPPMVAELERPARPAPQRLPSAPITGSVLGMAHGGVAPPVPMPVSTAPFNVNGN